MDGAGRAQLAYQQRGRVISCDDGNPEFAGILERWYAFLIEASFRSNVSMDDGLVCTKVDIDHVAEPKVVIGAALTCTLEAFQGKLSCT